MRLFIAIEIPEYVKDNLIKVQNDIGDDVAKIKWVNKNQMHLTLKFLGEVQEDNIPIIKEELKKIKFKPFSLELDKIGVFPSESYIRVVWVGIKQADKVIELQQEVDSRLEGLFKKEKRFHPHITLGRVKFVKDKPLFIESLKKIEIENQVVEVKDFRLIKSILAREGPVYEELGNFPIDAK